MRYASDSLEGSRSGKTWPVHEDLGVAPDAPEPTVKSSFCELVKDAHGDQGGNDAYDVAELKRARDAMLDE
jgi:hypothetical protein